GRGAGRRIGSGSRDAAGVHAGRVEPATGREYVPSSFHRCAAQGRRAEESWLTKLKQTKEEGESLLDRTMVFFSSNLGNASNHSTKNLPVLLAGGGFKHGSHLAFDPGKAPPLCNLYVSMLQQLGIEADKFGSSTGTLTGLETGT